MRQSRRRLWVGRLKNPETRFEIQDLQRNRLPARANVTELKQDNDGIWRGLRAKVLAILRGHRRLFFAAWLRAGKNSVGEAGRANVTISSGDTVPARLVNEIPPPIEASAKVRQSPKARTIPLGGTSGAFLRSQSAPGPHRPR